MNPDTDILVLAFTDGVYQSNKRLIVTGEWEHYAIPAEAREYMVKVVRDAMAAITDPQGKIDMSLIEGGRQ